MTNTTKTGDEKKTRVSIDLSDPEIMANFQQVKIKMENTIPGIKFTNQQVLITALKYACMNDQ